MLVTHRNAAATAGVRSSGRPAHANHPAAPASASARLARRPAAARRTSSRGESGSGARTEAPSRCSVTIAGRARVAAAAATARAVTDSATIAVSSAAIAAAAHGSGKAPCASPRWSDSATTAAPKAALG